MCFLHKSYFKPVALNKIEKVEMLFLFLTVQDLLTRDNYELRCIAVCLYVMENVLQFCDSLDVGAEKHVFSWEMICHSVGIYSSVN